MYLCLSLSRVAKTMHTLLNQAVESADQCSAEGLSSPNSTQNPSSIILAQSNPPQSPYLTSLSDKDVNQSSEDFLRISPERELSIKMPDMHISHLRKLVKLNSSSVK